jgi:hypothetical protein
VRRLAWIECSLPGLQVEESLDFSRQLKGKGKMIPEKAKFDPKIPEWKPLPYEQRCILMMEGVNSP